MENGENKTKRVVSRITKTRSTTLKTILWPSKAGAFVGLQVLRMGAEVKISHDSGSRKG